jgi:hypothetical protein
LLRGEPHLQCGGFGIETGGGPLRLGDSRVEALDEATDKSWREERSAPRIISLSLISEMVMPFAQIASPLFLCAEQPNCG